MAPLAGRDHLVSVFVTVNTVDALMLGIGLAVQLEGLLVACRTHLVGGIGRVRDSRRHMGLVTTLAVDCGHFRAMRFVTLGTEGNPAMYIVTETAGQSGVFALDLFQFDDLRSMAGETLIGDVVGQFDNFRSMRIVVAAQAAGKIVVRFAAVTLAAGRDDFFNRRRMTDMAILTTDPGFVGAAIGVNSFRCRGVTFDALLLPCDVQQSV